MALKTIATFEKETNPHTIKENKNKTNINKKTSEII